MHVNTTLTKIGNSSGVILQKKLLQEAGIKNEITIEVKNGTITIRPARKIKLNLDVSTWEAQIKKAIKAGNKPEKSIWGNSVSAEADKDWTWPDIK